jgi:hypothetical protein
LNSENRVDSQNGKFFKKKRESRRFLKPAPKTGTNGSDKKVRTVQHWSGLGSTVRDPMREACWMPYPWSDKGRQ